jgi:hypothetical protein
MQDVIIKGVTLVYPEVLNASLACVGAARPSGRPDVTFDIHRCKTLVGRGVGVSHQQLKNGNVRR